MAIDIRNEPPITLSALARLLPPGRRGKPVSLSCIFRWIVHGVLAPDGRTRVRLEASRCGGRWLTTMAAVERFIAAQTPRLNDEPTPAPRTPGQRERAQRRAGKLLDDAGF